MQPQLANEPTTIPKTSSFTCDAVVFLAIPPLL